MYKDFDGNGWILRIKKDWKLIVYNIFDLFWYKDKIIV